VIKINLLRDPFFRSAAKGGEAKNDAADVPIEAKMSAKAGTNKEGGKRAPIPGILSCLLLGGLGGLYYIWLGVSVSAEEDRGARLLEEKGNLAPYLELEERFREQSESLRKKEEALARLKKQQQSPVYFLQELANSLPDNVWFAKVASRGPRVEIRGESLTEDAIYQFRDGLVARDQWFRNVNFLGAIRRDKRLEFTLTFELVPG
jgi:Tfp pilus assembly protein PilN